MARETTKTTPAKKQTLKPKNGNVKKAVEEIEAAVTANGGQAIGFKVWWDLWRATCARSSVEAALTKVGLEWALPAELGPVQRMRQAGGRIKATYGADFRSAGRDGEWTTYRPVKYTRATDQQGKAQHSLTVDPSVLSSISVNRETEEVELGEATCEVGKAAVEQFKALKGQFVTFQVRQMIKSVLEGELHAVRIKRDGGLYYIPNDANTEETLKNLREVVQGIGECDLYVETVVEGSDTARAAGRGSMRSLDGKYAELIEAAREFIDKLESGDMVNGRSLNVRLEAARSLKRHTELYNSILDERGEKLAAAAQIVSDTVKKVVDASVDVRALNKAKKSDRAQEMAKNLMKDIAAEARAELEKAHSLHEPVADDDDDSE